MMTMKIYYYVHAYSLAIDFDHARLKHCKGLLTSFLISSMILGKIVEV